MRITIPRNEAQARQVADAAVLNGWALAGWVASQVTLDGTPGPRSVKSDRSLTPAQFAAKGIRGLRSKNTVQLYAERWRDNVGAPPRPGQVLNLPDMDWPPDDVHRRLDNGPRREAVERQAEADGTSTASAIRVAESPQAMAAAIKADPVAAAAAAKALVSNDEGIRALRAAEQEVAKERNDADPEFAERIAKVRRDAALDTEEADRAIAALDRKRHLGIIELWLKEWARDGDIEAIDLVGLMLDEIRGTIAAQAQELTPEMFTEGDRR